MKMIKENMLAIHVSKDSDYSFLLLTADKKNIEIVKVNDLSLAIHKNDVSKLMFKNRAAWAKNDPVISVSSYRVETLTDREAEAVILRCPELLTAM